MTDTLKPCPFCSNLPVNGRGHDFKKVACVTKNCPMDGLNMYPDEWNPRAPNKDRQLLIELSLPQFSTLRLHQIACNLSYTIEDDYSNAEAQIALKILKYLEENQ